MNADVAIVTETWLKEGPSLEQFKSDLELGANLCTLTLCREPNAVTGVAHGGVAIVNRKGFGKFKMIDFPNPNNYEVLPAVGTIVGSSRKMVVIAAYIPPNYIVSRGRGCVEHIEELIVQVKRTYNDPFIVLGGDFNQWQAEEAIHEFPDMTEAVVGQTRGDRAIDRFFTNMGRSIESSGTAPPLDSDDGSSTSDHRMAYFISKIARKEAFEWITYSYRLCTDEAKRDFGSWIVMQDWAEVLSAVGPDAKVKAYQESIDAAMDTFFPMKTTRRKSTQPPWLNKSTLKKIKRRNRIYVKEGKSVLWHAMKKSIEQTIKERKAGFMAQKKVQLTEEGAGRSFFRLVKSFSTPEKPQTFDVRGLMPGASDSEVAEELASFFNRISSEFDPLTADQVPTTTTRTFDRLLPHEVARRIKRFRKPKSMVAGDLYPDLVTKFSDFLAIPLTSIFNEIASTLIWPEDWKNEYVTVIPKCSSPQSFADLRNISCTKLVSKIMESFVLDWAGQEVSCKYNQ